MHKMSQSKVLNRSADKSTWIGTVKQNATIHNILQTKRLQAKLKVGAANDQYEREADRVADKVVSMSDIKGGNDLSQTHNADLNIQRACQECEEENLLQRQASNLEESYSADNINTEVSNLKSKGQKMSDSSRAFFESRFDKDFSRVRFHTDSEAAGSARAINARAYTFGNHVVFAQGEYNPSTQQGKRLIAHELTHVVQQSSHHGEIGQSSRIQRSPDDKQEPAWKDDYYYDTKAEAERRVAVLKKSWEEVQIKEIKVSNKTKWQVQKRKPKAKQAEPEKEEKPTTDNKATTDWTKDSQTFESEKDAEKRKKQLQEEDEWREFKVGKIEKDKKVVYCVYMKGKLTPGTAEFALTFDDGPHSATLGGGSNRTENVLDKLKSEGIAGKGGFFVQTHAPYRGSTTVGKQLIARMFKEGYDVGIHTGGKKDHESHPKAQKAGRLEGELNDAKTHLKDISGSEPTLVRAPYGLTNQAVRDVYKKVKLTHLHWDIDGDAGGERSLSQLKTAFDAGLANLTRGSKGTFHTKTGVSSKIVVLYHDIRKGTSTHIGDMVRYIRSKVKKATFAKPM